MKGKYYAIDLKNTFTWIILSVLINLFIAIMLVSEIVEVLHFYLFTDISISVNVVSTLDILYVDYYIITSYIFIVSLVSIVCILVYYIRNALYTSEFYWVFSMIILFCLAFVLLFVYTKSLLINMMIYDINKTTIKLNQFSTSTLLELYSYLSIIVYVNNIMYYSIFSSFAVVVWNTMTNFFLKKVIINRLMFYLSVTILSTLFPGITYKVVLLIIASTIFEVFSFFKIFFLYKY